TFLEGLIEGFDYLDFRSDTHAQNKAMQHIFEKLGFKQVGKVPVDGERLAYQKLKK
ncbi:MAG: GNAT family N-acetyltransferase, partial [Streptococcus sp.]|nr:GNAT family N-acetyltransferase [Streptococcus sp.]